MTMTLMMMMMTMVMVMRTRAVQFDNVAAVVAMVADWAARKLDVFFLETPLRMDMVRHFLARFPPF